MPSLARCAQLLAQVTLALAVALGAARADANGAPSLRDGRLAAGGRERTYRYYRPDGPGPFPLVLALHGRFGDGEGQERLSGLAALAARERFIAVFPDGYRRSWHDARESGPAAEASVDDVAFLSALVDELVARQGADPARVYAVGMSNGAMMALTLACRAPSRFAAVVAVSGLWARGQPCTPSPAVAVALVAGDRDPLVTFAGGVLGREHGAVESAVDTAAILARGDGCRTARPAQPFGVDAGDGTWVERSGYGDCADGAEVWLYTVHGGGHAWPGGRAYLGERVVGKTSRAFSATEEAWRFLSGHARRLPANEATGAPDAR